jgi:hypothetical protein
MHYFNSSCPEIESVLQVYEETGFSLDSH